MEDDYPDLLIHLKSTVETLLESNPSNVWDNHGGIQRLHVAITKLFKHGFRYFKDNGEPNFWVFIQGLSWLQPSLAASPSFLGHPGSPIRSPQRSNDKALTWLYKSIENHSLSEKLTWLLSDEGHVSTCYRTAAFLRQAAYCEATLICLRAVEQRRISLLAKIDPALYAKKKSLKKNRHGAPNPVVEVNQPSNQSSSAQVTPRIDESYDKVSESRKKIIDSIFMGNEHEKSTKDFIKKRLLKQSYSCSDLYLLYYKENRRLSTLKASKICRNSYSDAPRPRVGDTLPDNDSYLKEILEVRYDKPGGNAKTKRTPARAQQNDSFDSQSASSIDTIVHRPKSTRQRRKRRTSFFRLPFRIWEKSDDECDSVCSDSSKTLVPTADTAPESNEKKSFIESGGYITLPMSMGSFPKPSPGQSIKNFLSSGIFTQTNAELDRENAHFHVAEAMIAMLEQMKCDQKFQTMKKRLHIPDRKVSTNDDFVSADTTMTTDCSPNSFTSSMCSTCESTSADVDDENLLKNAKSGLSVSQQSLSVPNVDNPECRDTAVSAEDVAISLLRRFEENQLPAASEIEWLVSESETRQRILPLPDEKTTLLRGTSDWAPPRPQIIFTPHPPPVRQQLMEKQSYRCAGCGTTVMRKYASKYRYCEYLGRYFCTACHSNQTAVIPGRVLTKWDFTRFPVSNFSFTLLDQMSEDPLFNVVDLNPQLYRRVKGLQRVRLLRIALFYLKDFIFACRCTTGLPNLIRSEPIHIYSDPDSYSLADFIKVKTNTLHKSLAEVVKLCENHVNCCVLCQAQGFFCELCRKQEVIFPWQLKMVLKCDSCGSCHHIKCFKEKPICRKCNRISIRNELHSIGVLHGVIS